MCKDRSTTTYDCIVVGAGAAGLFYAAADAAGQADATGATDAGGRKLILEKTDRPGQKLLLSGNGSCNITHGGSIKDFISHYGDKGPRIRSCLYRHNNLELMQFMEDAGVPLMERDDRKVFPASMKARDILDALLAKASRNGFALRCGCEVTGIRPEGDREQAAHDDRELAAHNDRAHAANTDQVQAAHDDHAIRVTLADGTALLTRKLVIATGGASYPATGSDGSFMEVMKRDLNIETTELKPALAPVYIQNYPYAELAGISFPDVEVTCSRAAADRETHTLRGPMLLTHKGFSGPAMLHISQYVKPGAQLTVNYLPQLRMAEVYRKIRDDQPGNSKSIANYLSQEFGLPKAFAEAMFSAPTQGQTAPAQHATAQEQHTPAQSGPAARKLSSVGHKELENIVHLMMERKYTVSGTGGFREAMVTAGGVKLEEINTKNMSLKHHPNIHIIGEALDINGDTGGYNLQFAYSSARAAI